MTESFDLSTVEVLYERHIQSAHGRLDRADKNCPDCQHLTERWRVASRLKNDKPEVIAGGFTLAEDFA